jgi:hypothetical protein
MTATNEQIKAEAERRWVLAGGCLDRACFIIEVTREGWTPPEPVDPDVLAYEQWFGSKLSAGENAGPRVAYLAGARMAREQEQERAKVLLEYVRAHSPLVFAATEALAAYERAAR